MAGRYNRYYHTAQKLEENKETIAESNHLEQENYRIKLEIHTLREKNRLYDLLQEETAHQIDLLNDLFYLYDEEENPEKRRSLLAKITVIGAYIKRRGNLIFIREKRKPSIPQNWPFAWRNPFQI